MAVPLRNHCVGSSSRGRGPSHRNVTLSSWNTLTHGGCKVITALEGSALSRGKGRSKNGGETGKTLSNW